MQVSRSYLWTQANRGFLPLALLVGALTGAMGFAMASRGSFIHRSGGEHNMAARERDIEREHSGRLEPVERVRPSYGPATEYRMFDWPSVWTGVITGFAALAVLGALVTAVGFATGLSGTSSIVWAIIVAFVAFLIGGYVGGATTSLGGRTEGFVLGSMIWALAATFLVLVSMLGLVGASAAISGATGALGGNTQALAVGTLILLIVTYIGSVVGALLGAGRSEAVEPR